MGRSKVFVLLVTTLWSIVIFNTPASSQTGTTSALAIDVAASGDRSFAAASVRTQYFSTPRSNELLLAFVSADSSSSAGNSVTSMNGAGLTWELVARANNVPG